MGSHALMMQRSFLDGKRGVCFSNSLICFVREGEFPELVNNVVVACPGRTGQGRTVTSWAYGSFGRPAAASRTIRTLVFGGRARASEPRRSQAVTASGSSSAASNNRAAIA